MTADLSSQFVEHLRQNNHLTKVDDRDDAGRAGRLCSPSGQALGAHRSVGRRVRGRRGAFPRPGADRAAGYAVGRTAGDVVFPNVFLREIVAYPHRSPDGSAVLAVADPTNMAARRAAQIVLGADIVIKIAAFDDLAVVLNQRLGEDDVEALGGVELAQPREDDIESLRDLASGAPVVRAVSDLLEKAVELRAQRHSYRAVPCRADGPHAHRRLAAAVTAPAGVLPQAVISRIKIIASLNIAERRLPQDGAARLRAGRSDVDIRVAIMPTQYGESAVIRILPKDRGLLVVEKLGFSSADDVILRRLLKLPHGMIVITGPTGSGKTTTLATILSILNEPVRKILTIEDPVEYEIPGINQSQIKPAIGLTFAAALRSFVRQDPDVIMVGEVRDSETAHVAVHAALTGHLVLTTLHTETAAAAVPRLLDLGVEGYLLRSVLRAVVAQPAGPPAL